MITETIQHPTPFVPRLRPTVITSQNYPHYVGFGDQGWLWVKNYKDAKVFPTREEAEIFVETWLPGMVNDVWYLG